MKNAKDILLGLCMLLILLMGYMLNNEPDIEPPLHVRQIRQYKQQIDSLKSLLAHPDTVFIEIEKLVNTKNTINEKANSIARMSADSSVLVFDQYMARYLAHKADTVPGH